MLVTPSATYDASIREDHRTLLGHTLEPAPVMRASHVERDAALCLCTLDGCTTFHLAYDAGPLLIRSSGYRVHQPTRQATQAMGGSTDDLGSLLKCLQGSDDGLPQDVVLKRDLAHILGTQHVRPPTLVRPLERTTEGAEAQHTLLLNHIRSVGHVGQYLTSSDKRRQGGRTTSRSCDHSHFEQNHLPFGIRSIP